MYLIDVLWAKDNKSIWNYSVLAVALIGSFACFLPFAFNLSDVDLAGYTTTNSNLDIAVKSSEFKYSVVASVAVGTKMILDSFVNFFKFNEASHYNGIKSLLLSITTLLAINVYFINTSFQNKMPLLHCIIAARSIIRTCLALIYLDSSNNWRWRKKQSFITVLCYAIGTSLQNISKFSKFPARLFWIAIGFYILAFMKLVIPSKSWIIRLHDKFTNQGWSYGFISTCFHIPVCSIIVVAVIVLLLCHSYDWRAMDTGTLTSISYLELLFVVFLTSLQNKNIDIEMTNIKCSLETKRTFVRFVSHEIRTPLNTMSLGIDLLQREMRKYGNFPELVDITNDLKSSADIALTLVNDLLVYDKLEAGILKLELDHLPAWNLLIESIRPFQLQAKQAEIDLVLPSPSRNPNSSPTSFFPENIEDIIIIADKSRIRQVISNMISNALKFSPKYSNVTVDITFTPIVNESQPPMLLTTPLPLPLPLPESIQDATKGCQTLVMMFSVTDHGPGLSPENQSKLFKQIIQFNPGKLQGGGGSGLGLWISQRIATMHGGKLFVMSEGEGFGCTFTCALPVYIRPQNIDHDVTMDRNVTVVERALTSSSITPMILHRTLSSRILPFYDPTGSGGGGGGITRSPSHRNVVVVDQTVSRRHTVIAVRSISVNSTSDHRRSALDNSLRRSTDDIYIMLHRLMILVVDDVPMNRKMICRVLHGKCRGTVEAEDGAVAVQLVKHNLRIGGVGGKNGLKEPEEKDDDDDDQQFDVILMDYMMPTMNGPEATRLIRSLGFAGIILGVTGNAQPSEISFFLSAGANKVLIKPVNLLSLVEAISSVI